MTKLYDKLKLGMEYWKAITMIITFLGLITSAVGNVLQDQTIIDTENAVTHLAMAINHTPLETPKIVNNCDCKLYIDLHVEKEH